jgi:probable F420-dependent oxidoreductase
MKFSIGLPTCLEGMMYPVPFAEPEDLLRVAVAAEELGYYGVMGNDHMTTQRYVRQSFQRPPRFYEPLITYAYIAAHTSRIKLITGVIVLPMRSPVVLAKQVATLDVFSGGRVVLGVGVGAYREEFEALFPQAHRSMNRGQMLVEGLEALSILFCQDTASYRGRYFSFQDVQMYPKPLQDPLPILVGGNSPEQPIRAGRLAHGWLPAVLSPEEVAAGAAAMVRAAREAGRDHLSLEVAPQFAVSIASDHDTAVERLLSSQLYRHLESLKGSTLKGQDLADFERRNLVGTPQEVRRRLEEYRSAGVTHCSGMLFAADDIPTYLKQMELFAKEVMPEFLEK